MCFVCSSARQAAEGRHDEEEGDQICEQGQWAADAAAASGDSMTRGLLTTKLVVTFATACTACSTVVHAVARGSALITVTDLARRGQLGLVEHARRLQAIVVVVDGDRDRLVVRDSVVPVSRDRDAQLVPRDLLTHGERGGNEHR